MVVRVYFEKLYLRGESVLAMVSCSIYRIKIHENTQLQVLVFQLRSTTQMQLGSEFGHPELI